MFCILIMKGTRKMKTDKSMYIYIRDSKRNPVGCISYTVDGSDVKYTLSVCANGDYKKFTKRMAKDIADTRMETRTDLVNVLYGAKTSSRGGMVRNILNHVANTSNVGKAKTFAKKWLKEHKPKERVTIEVPESDMEETLLHSAM